MLKKLKKAFPAVVSALLCVTMLLGITASAASVWSETKALTSAKYNSNYIKWVEKYSAKESKSTVTFSKSRLKKFYEKQIEAIDSKNPQFAVNIVTKDEIVSVAYKGRKIKIVAYLEKEGMAIYMTPDEMTVLSVSDKEKMSMPITEDIGYDDLVDEMLNSYASFDNDTYFAEDLGISDNAKGKLFKLKSGEKTYYYEEFSTDSYDKIGFLFDANGNPLAMTDGEMAACFNISYKVKDSEFTVPKGYTEIEY